MHGDVSLGGAVWTYLTVVLFITAMLSAYVVIDSLRPARQRRPWVLREPLWTYTLGQCLYFALLVLGQVGQLRFTFAAATTLLTPFALAQGIAYLLRVVFPKAPARAAEEELPADESSAEDESSPGE